MILFGYKSFLLQRKVLGELFKTYIKRRVMYVFLQNMKIKNMYYYFIAVAVRYCAYGLLRINLGMCLTATLGLGFNDGH